MVASWQASACAVHTTTQTIYMYIYIYIYKYTVKCNNEFTTKKSVLNYISREVEKPSIVFL